MRKVLMLVAGVLLVPMAALAQDAAEMARKHYEVAMADVFPPGRLKGETGEGLCWRAAFSIHTFPKGYQAFREPAFVEQGIKYCDALVEAMAEGPDGYKGFIGPFEVVHDYVACIARKPCGDGPVRWPSRAVPVALGQINSGAGR